MKRFCFVAVASFLTLTTSAQAERSIGVRDIVNALIRDGEVSAACVRDAGPNEDLVDIRFQDVDGDGVKEYVATGTHACTCGASNCFQWEYQYERGVLKLMESYMLGP